MRRGRRADSIAAGSARWLLRSLAAVLGRSRREWVDAMLGELDSVPGRASKVVWALGGVRLTLVLTMRSASRAWLRHPGRAAALLLGAPPRAVGRRGPATPGTGQYLVGLACACATGLSVLVLRGLLEDSPYAFNAGRGAPAGIHPDWSNPMSLAFDLIVFASAAELLAVAMLTVLFLRSTGKSSRVPGSVRAALLASAAPLWVVLGATVLFGIAAHRSAPTTFDGGPAAGIYLTWAVWVGLSLVMAASAAFTTAASCMPATRGRGKYRSTAPGSDK